MLKSYILLQNGHCRERTTSDHKLIWKQMLGSGIAMEKWRICISVMLESLTVSDTIKASEMLVAPRISECFDLPWSALVCYSLLTSSFAPFGRSGRYVCLHHPASPFFLLSFGCLYFLLVICFFVVIICLFVCLFGWFVCLVCLFSLFV